ncbi:membrane protein [Bacillus phage vB_BcgM]|nr:membrane protein [Bacillus phage vB_BcgM]
MYILNLVVLLLVQVVMWIFEIIFTALYIILAITITLFVIGITVVLLIVFIPIGVAMLIYDKISDAFKGTS